VAEVTKNFNFLGTVHEFSAASVQFMRQPRKQEMSVLQTQNAEKTNLTMLTDFYEITMDNGYFENGFENRIAYFDMFFRVLPDDGGFAIMAGVQQIVDYIQNLNFTEEDICYLRGCGIFSEKFLNYLKNFHFCCDVWAVPEGMPIFPGEPIITVRGPVIQAQFLETMILLTINHQSLIATKANRICRAAGNRPVMEFGSRRAQGPDGAAVRPVLYAAVITVSRRWGRWLTAGCSFLIRNWMLSVPMRASIPITARSWWILTMF
jgi:nicotinic acid phosphoribosyltransferase